MRTRLATFEGSSKVQSVQRAPSKADVDLIATLGQRGFTVSARQLERWRQAGFIRTERRGTGRGKGSTSRYIDGSVGVIIELKELLAARRSLHDSALILFARDGAVAPTLVRRTLLGYLDGLRVMRGATGIRARDGLLATFRRSREGRAFLRRLRAAGVDEAVAVNIFEGFLRSGVSETAEAILLALEGSGLMRIAADLLDRPTVDRLREVFSGFNVDAVQRAVEAAEDQMLAEARDAARVLIPLVGDFIGLLSFTHQERHVLAPGDGDARERDLAIARFVPFLLFASLRGLDLKRALDIEQDLAAGLAGMASMAEALNASDGRLFGPGAEREWQRMKPYERRSFEQRLAAFVTVNPPAAEAIIALADSAVVSTEPRTR